MVFMNCLLRRGADKSGKIDLSISQYTQQFLQ
jgi:hypothetical protein